MMVFSIAARELRGLFLSPLAWAILAVIQGILAFQFLSHIEYFIELQPQLAAIDGAPGIADLVIAPLYADAAVVLLLITPLVTMRVFSEERRSRTISLLFSAPASMTEIVLGKYLGVLAFFMVMLAMLTLMPLSLLAGSTLDLGKLAACVLGLALVLAAFSAIGVYMSSLTEQPVIAAVTTFGLLLMLLLLDRSNLPGDEASVLGYLSMLAHYEPLLKGLFNSTDIIYYLLITVLFLGFTIRRLDAMRLRG
ncbi:MAG: ABC transporter permease subunit [Gammaproteobacteria bacterium]|nr:ABC transporter permease subunit [Gammaproteobacteria bacterium]